MAEQLIEVWTTKRGIPHPVKQFCREFGYPNQTECGETMYNNTHFATEDAAWRKLINGLELHVRSCGRGVADATSALARAHELAGQTAADYHAALEAYEKWMDHKREAISNG